MNCRQAKKMMEGYIYGDLTLDEIRLVRLHTEGCAVCRKDLDSRQATLDDSAPQISLDNLARLT